MNIDTAEAALKENPKHNFGKFRISHWSIKERPDEVKLVLSGCIVVRAQSDFRTEAIEYEALHSDFRPVDMGCQPPEYAAKIFMLDSGKTIMMGWEELTPL